MEANEVMNLNNIIYRLYDAKDMDALKQSMLKGIRMLVPCSYASFLMANVNSTGPMLVDPCCYPEEFRAAEEKYILLEDMDHLLWPIHADHSVTILESQIVSEKKRLTSPIYQNCYREYDIYDTLQLSVVHEGTLYGVLTLYRTTVDGAFTEDDAFWLQMLSMHLGKKFCDLSRPGRGMLDVSEVLERLRAEYALTAREYEILTLIYANVMDADIAEQIHISPYTLKKHIQNIYRKLGISSRWELLQYCFSRGEDS